MGVYTSLFFGAKHNQRVEIVWDSNYNEFQLFFPLPFPSYSDCYFHLLLFSISPKSSQFLLYLNPWFCFKFWSGAILEIRFCKYEFFTYLRWDLIWKEIPIEISQALRKGERTRAIHLIHISHIMYSLEQAFNHTKALFEEK